MQLNRIGLAVGDLDTMSDWYRDTFALRSAGGFDLPPYDLRVAILESEAGWQLELQQRAGAVGGAALAHPLDAALRLGYAFVGIAVDDVDHTYTAIVAAGGTSLMPPHPGPAGYGAFVADPEGNPVQITGPFPDGFVPPPGGPGGPR